MVIPATLRFGFVAILVFAALDASALTLLSDGRSVRYYQDFFFDTDPPQDTLVTPAVPFGPLDDAYQTSSMQLSHGVPGVGDELQGSVVTSSLHHLTFDMQNFVHSDFSIRFRVGGTGQFSLSGTLSDSLCCFSYVRLTGASGTIYERFGDYIDGLGFADFNTTGALAPGEYELLASSHAAGPHGVGQSGGARMNFSFTDTVPEPTTAVLLGTGLVGMLLSARSRRSTT